MSQLILVDQDSTTEIGRRDMHPDERLQIYHDCAEHEPLCFQGKCYAMHTVAWRIPEYDCVATVTCQSIVYVKD